jgi:hypothetical protein
MTKRVNTASDKGKTVSEENEPQQPRSEQEARVWEILEEARQKVKPIVKKEKEAEVLTSDLLSLRLKAL